MSPGIGALYLRRRPRVRVEALMSGGGQERYRCRYKRSHTSLFDSGIRSGTVPAPLVVGLGAACRIAKQEMAVRLIYLMMMPAIDSSIV